MITYLCIYLALAAVNVGYYYFLRRHGQSSGDGASPLTIAIVSVCLTWLLTPIFLVKHVLVCWVWCTTELSYLDIVLGDHHEHA